jgi:CHRD domain
MKKLAPALVLGAAVSLTMAALAPGAARENYSISGTLTATAEVPAPKAPAGAKGSFTGTFNTTSAGTATLKYKLTYAGLSGPATAAHIHMAKKGVAGPVIVPLCGPCKSPVSGSAKLTKAQVTAIESGGTYVNVHTAKNPGGEIRAQIASHG